MVSAFGPGLKRLVRLRDFVFLEATGVTLRSSGERVGYHLIHSISIPPLRPLYEHNLVRGSISLLHLFREVVEHRGALHQSVARSDGEYAVETGHVRCLQDDGGHGATPSLLTDEEARVDASNHNETASSVGEAVARLLVLPTVSEGLAWRAQPLQSNEALSDLLGQCLLQVLPLEVAKVSGPGHWRTQKTKRALLHRVHPQSDQLKRRASPD